MMKFPPFWMWNSTKADEIYFLTAFCFAEEARREPHWGGWALKGSSRPLNLAII